MDFARDVLRRPPFPWQEWLLIHAGELLPDGRPRFRIVLVLVARQNGKTEIAVLLVPFWMFVDQVPLILGTSTKLEYAKESWDKAVTLIEGTSAFDELRPPAGRGTGWKKEAPGDTHCKALSGSRYKIAASNAEGGRSLTIERLIADELRQQKDYSAWDAAEPATSARSHAQIWALSNAGDDTSVVLNDLREAALAFIETSEGDERLGLFEWSAPENADPLDVDALAQANPNLNRPHGQTLDVLLGKAKRAVKAGGEALSGFKTESMCIRVKNMNPAINADAWAECAVPAEFGTLKSRMAFCLDVSIDQQHATLAAAAVLPDDRVRLAVVEAWSGQNALREVRSALPKLLKEHRPQAFGWMPNGPAAALAAGLKARKGVYGWPPPGVKVEEIREEVAAVCMGFADLVDSRQILHSDDALINAHVVGSAKLYSGDVWRFSRKGEGSCDGAYAVAGAVHLARTLPKPTGKPRILTARE